ncbi:hypothetical protein HYPSUDRAFT_193738 [Hypholoma sublateritium FD-334 SS-4]|uniref:F-box domain-containing protein n=1 Tax=Hypholoma sublateritium (strain FD-334 SS-4) TaxID=945553 RepID=A0A0D2LYR5_HYPSF|nr:hypothetical protein HYPSUDRAFT_193738 [Hypholoma sublateritium FD-334 SS-4]
MKSAAAPSSTIVRLPLEVLEIFIQYSPISTQLAISRVCRFFHALSLRPLYRNVSLGSPAVVIACCKTLIANPSAAKAVRSLSISYTYYSASSNSLLSAYYSIIKRALTVPSGLHTLKLLVHDPYFVTLLNQHIFPALRQFECYLTPSIRLIDFLNRHPKITYLQISPNENTSKSAEQDCPLPTLDLPRLQYFAGNVQGVPCLGTACIIRAAILNWNIMDTDPDLAFSVLQRSSSATLALLSCRRRGWNLDLIEMVSLRLPGILSLHVFNILLVDSRPTQTYLDAIRSCLIRFPRLQRLEINCVDYWEMGNISCSLDEDLSTVTEWGEACLSLTEITLPHSNDLSWYKISERVWIPDPKHIAGAAWLSDAVASKQHHKWGAIAEGLKRTVTKTGTPPPESTDTIANVRVHLEDLLRSSTEATLIRDDRDRGRTPLIAEARRSV